MCSIALALGAVSTLASAWMQNQAQSAQIRARNEATARHIARQNALDASSRAAADRARQEVTRQQIDSRMDDTTQQLTEQVRKETQAGVPGSAQIGTLSAPQEVRQYAARQAAAGIAEGQRQVERALRLGALTRGLQDAARAQLPFREQIDLNNSFMGGNNAIYAADLEDANYAGNTFRTLAPIAGAVGGWISTDAFSRPRVSSPGSRGANLNLAGPGVF